MGPSSKRESWNKGKLIGQKPPLKPKDIWAIRIHFQNRHAVRDLALFNLAIDSKLRGCDLVNLLVREVSLGNQILPPSDGHSAQDTRTGPVRACGVDKNSCRRLDRESLAARRAVSLSKSHKGFPTRFNTPVRTDGASVGRGGRPQFIRLWRALNAARQGDSNLQEDEKPQGRSAIAGSQQAGKYGSIPGYRVGRCAGDFRAN